MPAPVEQSAPVSPEPAPAVPGRGFDAALLKAVLLSSPLWGVAIAIATWPIGTIEPTPGLDQSWVAGLYMEAARGMQAGTEVVFTYGPLGFLGLPSLYDVWLGRIAFLWSFLIQVALCASLIWAARRAFGFPLGVLVVLLVTSVATADPLLLAATVPCVAALFGDWTPRRQAWFAVGIGALAGIELLGSLRDGPTLAIMGLATCLTFSDRRRALPAFLLATVASFGLLWVVTGQALSDLGQYMVNTASVVSGYSTSMVVFGPGPWWERPAVAIGAVTVAIVCLAAARGLDRGRQIGCVVTVAAVTFLMYKHAVVREAPDRILPFVAASLAICLALSPYVRRVIAVPAVVVLLAFLYIGSSDHLDSTLAYETRARTFRTQLETMALPGRAEDLQRQGREWLISEYDLTPKELALVGDRTVHVAPWEANVAWAYDLNWDPLPVFQQYSAYTGRLDRLNAAKLESPSAPEVILWQNTAPPGVANHPGAVDNRWPAFESPAQMVAMFCRYRAISWSARIAVLRRGRDRCGPERPLRTVVTGNAVGVRLPATRPDEALLVRVDGLDISGVERLRTMLFRAARRSVTLDGGIWSLVGETAADGLLLRAPRWADYPEPFRLGRVRHELTFLREPGFLTGVDDSTELTLRFYAIPLRGPATLSR